MRLENFDDFCTILKTSGFSMGGGNPKGIYSVVPFTWENQDGLDTPVRWHTGDPVTDPWEWRMRVLEERNDIAYSKLFFNTSGFITDEWYPYFYALRRRGMTLDETYAEGLISNTAKRVYDIISKEDVIAFHEIKKVGGFTREENSAFERVITELQMKMFITMCGRTQRMNAIGMGYGWNISMFTTVERFWEERDVYLDDVDPDEAYEKIKDRILLLNPNAEEKTINRFIFGK